MTRVDNSSHWFLKLPRSKAKNQVIYIVNILGASSSGLELLETIGNSEDDLNFKLNINNLNKLLMEDYLNVILYCKVFIPIVVHSNTAAPD